MLGKLSMRFAAGSQNLARHSVPVSVDFLVIPWHAPAGVKSSMMLLQTWRNGGRV